MTKKVKNITTQLVSLIWILFTIPLAAFAEYKQIEDQDLELVRHREALIVIHVPQQIANNVLRDGIETKARVAAKIRIAPDGTASGRLRTRTREDGRVTIKAMTGRAMFDEDGEVESVRLEFLEANGELVTATVTQGDVHISSPDCLIWDLQNGTSGQVPGNNDFPETLIFDATGRIGVRHGVRQ